MIFGPAFWEIVLLSLQIATVAMTGYLLLVLFGRNGPVGAVLYDVFGITLAFRWTGAALAAGIMAFPLMVRAIRLGFAFVAAIPGQTQTIPSAIYNGLQVPGQEGAVVALVTVSIVLAMGALVLSEWLAKRMAARMAA